LMTTSGDELRKIDKVLVLPSFKYTVTLFKPLSQIRKERLASS